MRDRSQSHPVEVMLAHLLAEPQSCLDGWDGVS